MRYRLRTLLIAMAIVLSVMAVEWYVFWGPRLDGFLIWYVEMVILWRVVPVAIIIAVAVMACRAFDRR